MKIREIMRDVSLRERGAGLMEAPSIIEVRERMRKEEEKKRRKREGENLFPFGPRKSKKRLFFFKRRRASSVKTDGINRAV